MSASAGLEQMRSQLDDGSAYDAAGTYLGELKDVTTSVTTIRLAAGERTRHRADQDRAVLAQARGVALRGAGEEVYGCDGWVGFGFCELRDGSGDG